MMWGRSNASYPYAASVCLGMWGFGGKKQKNIENKPMRKIRSRRFTAMAGAQSKRTANCLCFGKGLPTPTEKSTWHNPNPISVWLVCASTPSCPSRKESEPLVTPSYSTSLWPCQLFTWVWHSSSWFPKQGFSKPSPLWPWSERFSCS